MRRIASYVGLRGAAAGMPMVDNRWSGPNMGSVVYSSVGWSLGHFEDGAARADDCDIPRRRCRFHIPPSPARILGFAHHHS